LYNKFLKMERNYITKFLTTEQYDWNYYSKHYLPLKIELENNIKEAKI